MVDFSVVEADELARNCTTRGGLVEVKSQERAVQEQRELTTLMSFYPALSDVPSSPREPIDPYSGEASVELAFGSPQDETKVSRPECSSMPLLINYIEAGGTVLRSSDATISSTKSSSCYWPTSSRYQCLVTDFEQPAASSTSSSAATAAVSSNPASIKRTGGNICPIFRKQTSTDTIRSAAAVRFSRSKYTSCSYRR